MNRSERLRDNYQKAHEGCPHIWFFATFGELTIKKCMVCNKTMYRTCDSEEWTDVKAQKVQET